MKSVRKNVPQAYFHNSQFQHLHIEQVFDKLLQFIRQSPRHEYRLSIGTDSQVGKHTVFVTAIHLHRIGKGAIGFITKETLPRPIRSLREKIYLETCKTLALAAWFTAERIDQMAASILTPKETQGDIYFEFHLDVGHGGATKELINEMVAMAKGTPFEPKIKPESYAATSYANRYTKSHA